MKSGTVFSAVFPKMFQPIALLIHKLVDTFHLKGPYNAKMLPKEPEIQKILAGYPHKCNLYVEACDKVVMLGKATPLNSINSLLQFFPLSSPHPLFF